MQPLDVFSAELDSLGFAVPLEGRIQREILRRLQADEPLARYFTGGIYAVETEAIADSLEDGQQARTLRLSMPTMHERVQVGNLSYLETNWLIALVTERGPSQQGTGLQHRSALVRQIRKAILGGTRGALTDALGDDSLLTEALTEWGRVDRAEPLPGGSLLLTLMPFKMQSDIDSTTQEFIE